MIRAYTVDGELTIHLDGPRSHLDAKALCSLIGQVPGRGGKRGEIGQQRVRIIVDNEGTTGAEHNAIEEK